MEKEFWKRKKLADFSEEEWEAVCMKCGKCCLLKGSLDGYMQFSNRVCQNFDLEKGVCSIYEHRLNPNKCVKVDMKLLLTQSELLPGTCAYRLLLEGKELPDYHPLVSGDEQSVHKARKTVLEMPVHSEAAHSEIVHKFLLRSGSMSEKEYIEEEKKAFSVYPLKFLESYPIVKPGSEE